MMYERCDPMKRKMIALVSALVLLLAAAGCAQKTETADTPADRVTETPLDIGTEMTFDIDGDGQDEVCTIGSGPTSGIMSFLLSAVSDNTLKYCSLMVPMSNGDLIFVKTGEDVRLRLLPVSAEKPVDFSLFVKDGEIVLSVCGEDAAYWWRQTPLPLWDESAAYWRQAPLPLSASSYIETRYAATPPDQTEQMIENEEYVIMTPYVETILGGFMVANNTYIHRLEITGRLGGAAKNTTYLVLANRKDITFDEAWRASGLSSDTADYFDPKDAVIVGYKLFS